MTDETREARALKGSGFTWEDVDDLRSLVDDPDIRSWQSAAAESIADRIADRLRMIEEDSLRSRPSEELTVKKHAWRDSRRTVQPRRPRPWRRRGMTHQDRVSLVWMAAFVAFVAFGVGAIGAALGVTLGRPAVVAMALTSLATFALGLLVLWLGGDTP